MTLTNEQLQELKNDLLHLKQRFENKDSIEKSADINTDETSFADNHFADAATEFVDRQTEFAEENLNMEQLREVNEALERMKDGTYGICVDTGEEISYERLKAKPYSKRTVQAEENFKTKLPQTRMRIRQECEILKKKYRIHATGLSTKSKESMIKREKC